MKGSVNDTIVSGEGLYYKLSLNKARDANSIGFYWDNADGTRMSNPAHKGYVLVVSSHAAKAFGYNTTMDFGTFSLDENDADIFDLSGRYVGRDVKLLPKGVYIRNNKKFVVK